MNDVAMMVLLMLLIGPTSADDMQHGIEHRYPSQEIHESVKRLRERVEEDLVPALVAPQRQGQDSATEPSPLGMLRQQESRRPRPPFRHEDEVYQSAACPCSGAEAMPK